MNHESSLLLQLKDVSKVYRTKRSFFGTSSGTVVALNRISLDISRGEIFGLVGESGSGKTTCGRLIVGLEAPEEGEIYLDGAGSTGLKGKALKAYRRKVQMIFQDPYQSLNPQLSIFESIAEPLTIHRMGNRDERQERVLHILKTVGLSPPEDFVYRYPHQLSGGQRQRVAIARAMVLKPELIVADEPTSMLDASYSAKIFNILSQVRDEFRVTILFITHSLAAARYLCDEIAVIFKGNLMEVGPADEVIQNPRHPYTRALIDAIPKFGNCGEVIPYDTLLKSEREGQGMVGCPFFTRCKISHGIKCSSEQPSLRSVGSRHVVSCFFVEAGHTRRLEGKECYAGI